MGIVKVLQLTHYRQNKSGQPLKLSREKYLRDDINCGSIGCLKCPVTKRSTYHLDERPLLYSTLFNFPHYLLPDSGFLLRQLDVLEELPNVIILQHVLDEVCRFNVTKYKRIREGLKSKKWHYFLNEHHITTYYERQQSDSIDDRNIKAFMKCSNYFQDHFASRGIKIIILSDDPEFEAKIPEMIDRFEDYSRIRHYVSTGENYVENMTKEYQDLEDKLCRIPFNEDEEIAKYTRGEFSFPPHLELNVIQDGIKAKRLFQGAYRYQNFYEGTVVVEGDSESPIQVLIQGITATNRACDGDIVCVELLPESDWSFPSGIVVIEEAEESDLKKENVVTGDEEEEEILSIIKNIKREGDETLKQPTGRVVGIIKRKWLPCCGIIKKSLLPNANYHFFWPDNKKLPRVRIETKNADRFEGKKIVVQIDQWPATSRYPVGHYLKLLGPKGTIETETEAILYEHGIPHKAFTKDVESCLPRLPFAIPEEEYTTRKDFRQTLVVSVDPPGCTDIDDALHAVILPDGTYEVGVHIADVSYFVRPGTALDAEAAKRGTTVYLADRRIDMIPSLLSSNLASLHCNVDKLVFSVVWKMSVNAKILETKYYKGIINSKAAMTYAAAQQRLNSSSVDPITSSLRILSLLAQILRKNRFENGALMLSSSEANEDEEDDNCEESHSMVEEFMLLANCSVAEFMLDSFKEFAPLRRHPVPPPANFDPLIRAAKTHGISVVVDRGSKALNDSLLNSPPALKDILRILCTRCMTQALYCCSGNTSLDELHHFGLAVRIYTHFTSPIRRYADLMVHRVLAIALQIDPVDPRILDSKRVTAACENINLRHRMAQYASRASSNIHKSKLLKGNDEEHLGYILFIRRNALLVHVPKYKIEGYIFFPPKGNYVYDEKELTVTFGDIKLHPLDSVKIRLSLQEETDKVLFRLVSPKIEGL